MLSHGEQTQFRSSFGVMQESGFHHTNNLAAQGRGGAQTWFQPAVPCSGGKLSLKKGLEILKGEKCGV